MECRSSSSPVYPRNNDACGIENESVVVIPQIPPPPIQNMGKARAVTGTARVKVPRTPPTPSIIIIAVAIVIIIVRICARKKDLHTVRRSLENVLCVDGPPQALSKWRC